MGGVILWPLPPFNVLQNSTLGKRRADMTKEITIEMIYKKATPNKLVYQATTDQGPVPISSIYVEKWHFGSDPPQFVTLHRQYD
jgi:hypothetical protein